jgi:hypothetical protein
VNIENKIEELILAGAVEVSGIDAETGDFLYSFTDKIHEVDPEIARESRDLFNRYMYALWEMGFIHMDIDSDNPMVSLLPKCFVEDEVAALPKDLSLVLRSVMEALRL